MLHTGGQLITAAGQRQKRKRAAHGRAADHSCRSEADTRGCRVPDPFFNQTGLITETGVVAFMGARKQAFCQSERLAFPHSAKRLRVLCLLLGSWWFLLSCSSQAVAPPVRPLEQIRPHSGTGYHQPRCQTRTQHRSLQKAGSASRHRLRGIVQKLPGSPRQETVLSFCKKTSAFSVTTATHWATLCATAICVRLS